MKALLLIAVLSIPAMAVDIAEDGQKLKIKNEHLEFTYDLKSGVYSGKDLQSGVTAFNNAKFTVDEYGWKQPDGVTREWSATDLDDATGKGRRLNITETPNGGYRLTKTLHISVYDNVPYAVLGFSVKNHRELPARVTTIGVIDRAKLLPGKELTEPRLLPGGAGAQPNRVKSDLDMLCFNNLLVTGKIDGKRQSIVVGGLQYLEFLRQIEINKRRGYFSVTIDDPLGKLIAPGDTYVGKDTVFLDFSTVDPFVSLERYGMAMRAANDAKPKIYDFPTLCGWLVSTGSYGEGVPINNSKALVGQMELAKESGILDYTPVGIRLEPDYYCNQNYGDTQQGWWNDEYWAKYGSLTPPYDTFGKFCGKISELGGVPFTYIQTNMPSNDFAIKHPEWMLNNDITRIHSEHRHHMPFVKFDFTDPGFQKHVLDTWTRLGKQGLMGIKFDYPESGWCKDGGFEDKSYTTTSAYRKVFELCRAGLGERAYIHERNLGEYGTPCLDVTAGIIDLQRVWGDSSHFEPEMASRIGLRWYKNRSVFGYYPDGKSFKKMDTDARRTMLTQVGLISGRLELGTSFGRMTKEEQHDLTRLYPMFEGTRSFRPVDMLLEDRMDPSVYVYQIDSDWSQIILCNNHDEDFEVKVPISGDQADTGSLGHDAEGEYYLYDFWNDKLVGLVAGDKEVSQTLKPYQALTYSLHKKREHPQFLSTNRHIMQGYVDLSDVKWEGKSMTYAGSASVVGSEPFVITFANNGFTPGEVEVSSGKAEITDAGEGLSRMTLTNESNSDVKWSVSWSK